MYRAELELLFQVLLVSGFVLLLLEHAPFDSFKGFILFPFWDSALTIAGSEHVIIENILNNEKSIESMSANGVLLLFYLTMWSK